MNQELKGGTYTLTAKTRAFVRGLGKLEPLVEVAKEGLKRGNPERYLDYVMKVASSRGTGTDTIFNLLRYGSVQAPQISSAYPANAYIPPANYPLGVSVKLSHLYYKAYLSERLIEMSKSRILSPTESELAFRGKIAWQTLDLLTNGNIRPPDTRDVLTSIFVDSTRRLATYKLDTTGRAMLQPLIRLFPHVESVLSPTGLNLEADLDKLRRRLSQVSY
jgi:hypothetical protein